MLVDQSDDLNETLSKLDMQKVKDALKRYYTPEAYMLLLDAWRRESVKVQDAIMSYKSHVAGESRGWTCGRLRHGLGHAADCVCLQVPAWLLFCKEVGWLLVGLLAGQKQGCRYP